MDDDQQFCLRWNNHQSTLISVFDTLLENGTLVDCTLAAEGQFLKAHKVVLSACSPYFASLLSQQYDKHPIFILKDVKFQELRAMMDYMYRGEVNISQDQLAALLKAAESLQIKGLSDSRGGGGGNGSNATNAGNNGGQKIIDHKQPQLSVPVSAAGKSSGGVGGVSSGYTLEQKRPRHAMGPLSIDTQELAGSREGSSSPTSRKRKKIRRRSLDNIMADNHELSNSSSHSMQINSSTAPSNTSAAAATTAATSSSSFTSTTSAAAAALLVSAAATGLNVTKKTDNSKMESGVEQDMDNDDETDHQDQHQENNKNIVQMKKEQNHKRKSQVVDTENKDNSDMLIEPKSEYDDGNDETVEDLTLDEEELLEDLEQAGPSHGGEGSSQGYAQWQDHRSQDEVFLAAQEAAGQQRDPQGQNTKGPSFARIRVRNWLMMTDHGRNLENEYQNLVTPPTPAEEGNALEDDENASENGNGGVVIKCERHSPSPSLYNNSQHSNQSQDFNYDLKISSPISWAFEPIKSEKSVAATTIYTAVKKTLKTTNSVRARPIAARQVQVPNHGNEKKYRILFQNQRIRKESLEHSSDMIYNGDYEKPWICRNCNRNYKWKNSLKCHLKNECGQPPRFFCSKMCGYRTNVHSNLKRHLNTKCRSKDDEPKPKAERY